MPAPTSVEGLDLARFAGKTYFNIDREWREEFIYFLMVDRFQDDPSGRSPTGPGRSARHRDPERLLRRQDQGHHARTSDYIAGLGCTAIWLSPVFENNPTPTTATTSTTTSTSIRTSARNRT